MAFKNFFQNEDGTPNWSFAPADAQFYHPESDEITETFLKVEDGHVYFVNAQWGMDSWTEDEWGEPADVDGLVDKVAKPV